MATEDLDKVVLAKLVRDNTEALTKLTDILNNIDCKFDNTLTKYGTFDKSMLELKTYMKVLVGIAGATFVSFLAGLVIYVLK